jgi:glycosyltransferase involved in cell wall biosynthesis
MKLVYVNDVVYAYATGDPLANGGAERYAWHLTRALANSGWSVTVGVRYALKEGEERVVEGVRFVGLTRRSHFLSDWYRFLRKERPDWCFSQCADHLWGPTAEIARWLGVRTAFSAMHDLDVQPRKAMTHARKNLWFLYKWGLQRSNLIFVQHHGQRDQLPMRWQRRAYVLPGIVPLSGAVVPHPVRNGTVLWMAVIRPAKRPDRLVEIARRLPMIRFVVCGAPNYRLWDPMKIQSVLAQLHSLPNVDYRGHVDPKQTVELIGDASLLLLTSDGEGFPSVFLEAWAAGTPVVSIKIDPDQKIQRGDLGIVTDNVEGAVKAVCDLMTSPQRRQDMGMRARRHVEETHSPHAAVRVFERAVASVSA